MHPTEQQTSIEEYLGWIRPRPSSRLAWHPHDPTTNEWNLKLPPDYVNDLNAIHKAEGTIFKDEIIWRRYRIDEMRFLWENDTRPLSAAQRCECFLRAIGKWATPATEKGAT